MRVAFKLQSQINFLKSLDRPEYSEAITGLTVYLAKINSPIANEKCDDFLTIEERSGHLYFSNYVKLFPPNYWFEWRLGSGLVVSTIMRALDLVNAFSNCYYSYYSAIAPEIANFVSGLGLAHTMDIYA